MIRYILIILFITFHTSGIAQDSIVTGSRHRIYSKTLLEERMYSIALPVNYSNKKYTPARYPVLYVLDGESSFEYTRAIVKFLSKGVYPHIPEMIVIGIHNTNRTRDFTPTKASVRSPDNPARQLFGNSGGGEDFFRFIAEELVPHLDSAYRTNGYKIISGHSFGGLVIANMLLQHPGFFNAYIVHDPSYWWDEGYTLKDARKRLPRADYKSGRMFLSQAGDEEKGSFKSHFESVKIFKHIVDSVQNTSLNFQYKYYGNEDHGTIPFPATFDGLKFIFEGYWADFKKLSVNKNHLAENYASFSKEMGFTFNPSEPMLDFIINYFKAQDKTQEAEAVLKQYQILYPETAPVKL